MITKTCQSKPRDNQHQLRHVKIRHISNNTISQKPPTIPMKSNSIRRRSKSIRVQFPFVNFVSPIGSFDVIGKRLQRRFVVQNAEEKLFRVEWGVDRMDGRRKKRGWWRTSKGRSRRSARHGRSGDGGSRSGSGSGNGVGSVYWNSVFAGENVVEEW